MRHLLIFCMTLWLGAWAQPAMSGESSYQLGPNDVLRISVHNNPDLTLETRVLESGVVTFPLIGEVQVGGLTTAAAEKKIASLLESGGFVKQPQVNILVTQFQSKVVSVLGMVNKPGRYPLDRATSLADLISLAGGIAPTGSDVVIVNKLRAGKFDRIEVDIDQAFRNGGDVASIEINNGDTVYVPRAPLVYIYGEVQRPGAFRIERDMTVIQALAQGGGPTVRGTQRGIQLHRRNAQGAIEKIVPQLTDKVQADDVLFVPESLF